MFTCKVASGYVHSTLDNNIHQSLPEMVVAVQSRVALNANIAPAFCYPVGRDPFKTLTLSCRFHHLFIIQSLNIYLHSTKCSPVQALHA